MDRFLTQSPPQIQFRTFIEKTDADDEETVRSSSSCLIPRDSQGSLRKGTGRTCIHRRISWQDLEDATSQSEPCESPISPKVFPSLANVGDDIVRTLSAQKIDDRRESPSEADHGDIIGSFQQGLASVESVIIYDPDHGHDVDSDGDGGDDGILLHPPPQASSFASARGVALRQLCDLCIKVCACCK
ncbi:unnamed protein product [Polarella glacialis]|uniref:Uncharacterized protein n=1 Tax=Polarella glacialis TaxID=89957 RepID=A0A813K3J1_POLGL|nr:unnamed protein product [Polarella glacialis]